MRQIHWVVCFSNACTCLKALLDDTLGTPSWLQHLGGLTELERAGSHRCRWEERVVPRVSLLPLPLSRLPLPCSNRFRRLRVKILHNFKPKKSKIDLWGVKLQHKAWRIFLRGEIFRESKANDKDLQRDACICLCKYSVFALDSRKISPRKKIFRLYVVILLPINRFWIFLA